MLIKKLKRTNLKNCQELHINIRKSTNKITNDTQKITAKPPCPSVNKRHKRTAHSIVRKSDIYENKSPLNERRNKVNTISIKINDKPMTSEIITCKSKKKTGISIDSICISPETSKMSWSKNLYPKSNNLNNSFGCCCDASNSPQKSTNKELNKRDSLKRRRSRKDRKHEKRILNRSVYDQYNKNDNVIENLLYKKNNKLTNNELNTNMNIRNYSKAIAPLNSIKILKHLAVPDLKDLNAKRYLARRYLGELYSKIVLKNKLLERSKKFEVHLQNINVVINDCKTPIKRCKSRRVPMNFIKHM